jgi:hypothetical protein
MSDILHKDSAQTPPSHEPSSPEHSHPVEPPHHHHHGHGPRSERHHRSGFNLARLFVGGLVLLAGIVYLARNAGWISYDLTLTWSMVWPVLLVAFGLSLIRVRGFLGTLLGVLMTTILIILVLGLAFVSDNKGYHYTFNNSDSGMYSSQIIIAKEAAVQNADISLKVGAGDFRVYGGSASSALISGMAESTIAQTTSHSEISGTSQRVSIDQQGRGFHLGRNTNRVSLGLATDVPLNLTVEVGASDTTLDLGDVILQNLNINAGASNLTVIVGDKSSSHLIIDAGASSVSLVVPQAAGVKISLDSGLSSKNIAGFNQADEHTYVSENYDTAEKKIEVDLHSGASDLDVQRR